MNVIVASLRLCRSSHSRSSSTLHASQRRSIASHDMSHDSHDMCRMSPHESESEDYQGYLNCCTLYTEWPALTALH